MTDNATSQKAEQASSVPHAAHPAPGITPEHWVDNRPHAQLHQALQRMVQAGRPVIQRAIADADAKAVGQYLWHNNQSDFRKEWTSGLQLSDELREANYTLIAGGLQTSGFDNTPEHVAQVGNFINSYISGNIKWKQPGQDMAAIALVNDNDVGYVTPDVAAQSQPAYSGGDQTLIDNNGLRFERQKNDGDRLYKGTPAIMDRADANEARFLYRAMTRAEADKWRGGNMTVADFDGVGWPMATYFKYSETYMTQNDGYTDMLEFYVPTLYPAMKEMGFAAGKPEARVDGDLSFGVGTGNQNSYQASGPKNAKARELWAHYLPNDQRPGNYLAVRRQLTGHIFLDRLVSVRTVMIRSQQG